MELSRTDLYLVLLVVCNLAVLAIPVITYVLYCVVTKGETGLRSYEGVNHER